MTKDNFLLIILDSVRKQNISSYGYNRANFNKTHSFFANLGGTQYTEARSCSIWSYPSHVSMFTGAYPHSHDVISNNVTFDPTATETIFDILTSRGYKTGVFSTNPFLANEAWNLQNQFTDPVPHKTETDIYDIIFRSIIKNKSLAQYICETAFTWIKSVDSPWGVCLNLMDAHTPYIPTLSDNQYESTLSILRPSNTKYSGDFDVTQKEFRKKENLYDGCIHQCDTAVFRLLSKLHKNGYLNTTDLVLTSDHGEGFGELNEVDGSLISFHWNSVNEENLSIPLYRRRPNQDEFKQIDDLATLRRLPDAILRDEMFSTDRCIAHHRYGSNLTVTDDFDGDDAYVMYEQSGDTIHKHIVDPRGVTSSTNMSKEEIRNRVTNKSEMISDSTSLVQEKIDKESKKELQNLGYISS